MAVSTIPKQHEPVIPVAQGGTGATIPQDAKTNLGLVRFVKNTGANETVTLTFTGSVRALMFFYSSNAARNGAYMLIGSTGNTQAVELRAGSGITITSGTGQVSITTQYSVGFWILSLGDMDAITFPS